MSGAADPGTRRREMTLSLAQQRKAGLVAAASYPLVAALALTLKWEVEGEGQYEALVQRGRAPILALWHGRILPATLYWRRRGIVAMTSENFDGEWVARLMARFGFRAARGSTSHGGSRALVQLRRELSGGRTAAFTVDGPRGPARVAQRGAVWLAGATGHPVLPFHIEAGRSWTLGSWDRGMIPKPFTTVAIAIGEPLDVAGTDPETVDAGRLALEQRLALLEARCRALLAK